MAGKLSRGLSGRGGGTTHGRPKDQLRLWPCKSTIAARGGLNWFTCCSGAAAHVGHAAGWLRVFWIHRRAHLTFSLDANDGARGLLPRQRMICPPCTQRPPMPATQRQRSTYPMSAYSGQRQQRDPSMALIGAHLRTMLCPGGGAASSIVSVTPIIAASLPAAGASYIGHRGADRIIEI